VQSELYRSRFFHGFYRELLKSWFSLRRIKFGGSLTTRTPLFMALRDRHIEMAQMFIAAGADVNFVTM
jgi:hypothetical protein